MACLRAALDLNRTLGEVLSGAAAMNLPGWYLVAGCIYQTVWNVITPQERPRLGMIPSLGRQGAVQVLMRRPPAIPSERW
jgi:Nucleotidyltransferase